MDQLQRANLKRGYITGPRSEDEMVGSTEMNRIIPSVVGEKIHGGKSAWWNSHKDYLRLNAVAGKCYSGSMEKMMTQSLQALVFIEFPASAMWGISCPSQVNQV